MVASLQNLDIPLEMALAVERPARSLLGQPFSFKL
jgi:hypothetical protein